MIRPGVPLSLAAAASVVLLVAGCSGSSSGGSSSSGAASSGATSSGAASSGAASVAPASSSAASGPAATPATRGQGYYLSIGDSYAAGYQPTSAGGGATNRNGFAYQTVTKARPKGYDLTLENLGCAGATTSSVLNDAGCPARDLGPGADSYSPKTQVAAAEDFLHAHRGKVTLITVSVGGNDITACGQASNPTSCLTTTLTSVKANLATLLSRLRAAAGPTTRIVGITYPDVLLAGELKDDPAAKSLAGLSVLAFRSLINPALASTYAAAGATFLDVTSATGAYGSLTATTTLAPYGTIPVPVATLCKLTYACQYPDIHPRTNGYALIADLVVGALG